MNYKLKFEYKAWLLIPYLINFLTEFQRAFKIINMSGVVSIQGNVGAGKSTLLSLLDVSIIKQPVDEWENTSGGSILERYYNDPKRWAFTFQLNALHSRTNLWKKITQESPETLHFSERSPLADRYIFGEIMAREGNFQTTQYQIYNSLCETLMSNCPIKALIYLKCSPDLCLERIKQRGRKGQQGITLEYLKKVHERHQAWIQKQKQKIPVLTIDSGIHDIYSQGRKEEVISMIQNFIKKNSRE